MSKIYEPRTTRPDTPGQSARQLGDRRGLTLFIARVNDDGGSCGYQNAGGRLIKVNPSRRGDADEDFRGPDVDQNAAAEI